MQLKCFILRNDVRRDASGQAPLVSGPHSASALCRKFRRKMRPLEKHSSCKAESCFVFVHGNKTMPFPKKSECNNDEMSKLTLFRARGTLGCPCTVLSVRMVACNSYDNMGSSSCRVDEHGQRQR